MLKLPLVRSGRAIKVVHINQSCLDGQENIGVGHEEQLSEYGGCFEGGLDCNLGEVLTRGSAGYLVYCF